MICMSVWLAILQPVALARPCNCTTWHDITAMATCQYSAFFGATANSIWFIRINKTCCSVFVLIFTPWSCTLLIILGISATSVCSRWSLYWGHIWKNNTSFAVGYPASGHRRGSGAYTTWPYHTTSARRWSTEFVTPELTWATDNGSLIEVLNIFID